MSANDIEVGLNRFVESEVFPFHNPSAVPPVISRIDPAKIFCVRMDALGRVERTYFTLSSPVNDRLDKLGLTTFVKVEGGYKLWEVAKFGERAYTIVHMERVIQTSSYGSTLYVDCLPNGEASGITFWPSGQREMHFLVGKRSIGAVPNCSIPHTLGRGFTSKQVSPFASLRAEHDTTNGVIRIESQQRESDRRRVGDRITFPIIMPPHDIKRRIFDKPSLLLQQPYEASTLEDIPWMAANLNDVLGIEWDRVELT